MKLLSLLGVAFASLSSSLSGGLSPKKTIDISTTVNPSTYSVTGNFSDFYGTSNPTDNTYYFDLLCFYRGSDNAINNFHIRETITNSSYVLPSNIFDSLVSDLNQDFYYDFMQDETSLFGIAYIGYIGTHHVIEYQAITYFFDLDFLGSHAVWFDGLDFNIWGRFTGSSQNGLICSSFAMYNGQSVSMSNPRYDYGSFPIYVSVGSRPSNVYVGVTTMPNNYAGGYALYPYAFVNPNTYTHSGTSSTWSFSFSLVSSDWSSSSEGYYDIGYQDGLKDGESLSYQIGHDVGYAGGYATGYNEGYDIGYNVGHSVSDYSFMDLFGAIADTPILMIRSLFNFDVFGMNLLTVVMSLFTAMILFYLLRKLF